MKGENNRVKVCKKCGVNETVETPFKKDRLVCYTCSNKETKRCRDAKREEHLLLLEEYLGEPKCVDCGMYSKEGREFFDFHHIVPGNKKLCVTTMVGRYSWEAIKEELDKCTLLCPNCHRIRHIKMNRERRK